MSEFIGPVTVEHPAPPQPKRPLHDRGKYAANRYPKWQQIEQQQEALRLVMTGAGTKAIAKSLGLGVGTTLARIDAAYDSMRPHADYDRYRAVQLAEIDMMRRKLRLFIVSWNPLKGGVKEGIDAIKALLQLQEREAKLLGLDRVPTPFDDLSALSDDKLEEIIKQFADEMTDEVLKEMP